MPPPPLGKGELCAGAAPQGLPQRQPGLEMGSYKVQHRDKGSCQQQAEKQG